MDLIRRGDVVTAVFPGEYGKPRLALVVQSDLMESSASVILALLTSDLDPVWPMFRKRVIPTSENGLRLPSDVMVDKLVSVSRGKIGGRIGSLTRSEMVDVTELLAVILGF